MDEPRNGAHYGPPTNEMRGILKISLTSMIDQVWAKDGAGNTVPRAGLEMLFDKLVELVPHSDAQRSLQSEAESLVINLAQTRLLLFAQSRSFGFHNITGGSGLLAEHALRKLRLIRAGQCNHNRHIGSRGDICIRGIVPNS
jgi:hypothetical protein